MISIIGGAISTLLVWNFATNIAILITFTIIYGTFGSGFTNSFPSLMIDIAGTEYPPILVNGCYMTLRGIGNAIGGPIGSVLLTSESNQILGYKAMVYFVGSILTVSGVFGVIMHVLTRRLRV